MKNLNFKDKKEYTLLKQGAKIKGFIGLNSQGWFFAYGKPSQNEYIAFQCSTKNDAKKLIIKNL